MQINIEFFYKLILSFCVCTFRHAKSTQNKYTYLCNIVRRTWLMKLIFWLQISTNVFYKLLASLWVCVARHAQSTQSNKFEYLRNTSRKTWRMKFIFCLQINIKCFFKIILSFWVSVASMPKLSKITSLPFFCNILREKRVMKLIFLQTDKHKVSYKLILWFLMGMVKHFESSQNSKFAMSLQNIEKEFRDEVDFFHDGKQQLLFCSIVMQNIQIFYGDPVTFVVTSNSRRIVWVDLTILWVGV